MSQAVRIVVVGLGRAGKARVRDITTNVLGENVAELKGIISRHKPEDLDVPLLSWDDALSRSDVDAFVICTENNTHDEFTKKVLAVGKHVLVDFPLTTSFTTTKQLVCMAEEKGVILQEEDIGLLTDAFVELSDKLKEKPKIVAASMVFTAQLNPTAWVCDLQRGGFPSFSGVNRLHMVYELFGEMKVKDAKFVKDETKREMLATLLVKDNVPLVWTETRATGNERTFKFNFTFEDGTTMDYAPRMGPPPRPPGAPPPSTPAGPPKGLFARDLGLFLQKIRGEIGAEQLEKDKKRVLHCAEIAGKIEEMATAVKK